MKTKIYRYRTSTKTTKGGKSIKYIKSTSRLRYTIRAHRDAQHTLLYFCILCMTVLWNMMRVWADFSVCVGKIHWIYSIRINTSFSVVVVDLSTFCALVGVTLDSYSRTAALFIRTAHYTALNTVYYTSAGDSVTPCVTCSQYITPLYKFALQNFLGP